jgi:hypothetical protein
MFLMLLAGSAGAGLTVVRLNQEKSRLAADTVKYESEKEDTDRRLQEAAAAVAQAQQPDALKARIGDRLVPMQDKQIVWVNSTSGLPSVDTAAAHPPVFNFRLAANGSAKGAALAQ